MPFDPAWEKKHAERAWGRWPNEHFVRFVAKRFPSPGARFLELGCGAGAQLHFLAAEGHRAVGIDASTTAIERARKRCALDCEVDFEVADVAEIDWPAAIFDCVFDVACLQYLSASEAKKVIRRARKWLRRGGRMLSLMSAIPTTPSIHTVEKARIIQRDQLPRLFDGWSLTIGHEVYHRADGDVVSHWVIDAEPKL